VAIKRSPPLLRRARVQALHRSLEALLDDTDPPASLSLDPLSIPSGYADPADIEVAALLASSLSFGRVAAFLPVLKSLMQLSEDHGGPARWAMELSEESLAEILPLQYRWVRGQDMALLAATAGAALRTYGRIGALFEANLQPGEAHIGSMLEASIGALHDLARIEARRLGFPAGNTRRRGFISLLSRPGGGSACKRMCMLLRWMSRAPGPGPAGVDLGLWAIPPAQLVIPLDTHLLRSSQLIGLTRRTDFSWRTALEITAALRKICPEDPIRYDFALAHLGINGDCKARHVSEICGNCALRPVCRHGGSSPEQIIDAPAPGAP
jgi:uncharacterized protein (TIGR02757 family)